MSGFVAARAKEDALKLDEDEATQVAEAVANVGKHYDVPISPVTQAWVALGMTVGGIYAAKIAAIKLKNSNVKKQQPDLRVVNPSEPVQTEAAE